MSDGEQAFAEIRPKLLSTVVAWASWNAQALAGTFRIIICIKRLLLDAGGTGRCHIVVKTTGNVRYLTDHLTAECSTSLFVLQLCICDFSLLYRLCYHGPLRMKSCPKTFRSTLSFYEKDAVAGISLVFVRALNRHVAAAGAVTKHTSLSILAPFSCALF